MSGQGNRPLLLGGRRRPKGVHNAGILTFETTVHYPFHPLKGRSFLVVGEFEHYGAPHVLVRDVAGATWLVPAWMTAPEAGRTEIVDSPRLPVGRLIDLREVLDRIMIASSPAEIAPAGGLGNEAAEGSAVGSVRRAITQDRIVGASASGSTSIGRSSAVGGNRRISRGRQSKATGGEP
jgi:hypothetical protein